MNSFFYKIKAISNSSRIAFTVCIMACLILKVEKLVSQDFLYEYKRILADPTLTDNYISGVVKDNNGMIWLGTSNGLFRFDGYATQKIDFGNSNSNDNVRHINQIESYQNQLIIATNEGLYNIDCFNNKLIPFPFQNKDKIIQITTDSGSGIWWLTKEGTLFNYYNNGIRSVTIPSKEAISTASLIVKNDKIIAAINYPTTHEVLFINRYDLQTISKVSLGNNFIWNCRNELGNNIEIIATPQSYLWLHQENKLITYADYSENTYDILKNQEGTFTVNNENQLFHIYKKDGIVHKTLIPLGADKPEKIYKLYDINHCIYAATSNGLIIVNYQKNLFDNIFSTFDPVNNTFLVPRGIAEDDKNIYLATYQQLIHYNKISHQTKIIQKQSPIIRALIKDVDTLWLGTEGSGLKQFILSQNKMINTNAVADINWNSIVCMTPLDEHRIIIGGYKNLLVYDKRSKIFSEITVNINRRNVCENQVNQILVLKPNRILIATGQGVFLINEQGLILKNYTIQLTDKESLRVFAIVAINENDIWCASANGLYNLDQNGKILHHLTRNEGMAGNMIISLVPDKKGNLWAASFTGLSCVNLKSLVINNFYKEDGLPNNEFNHSSFLHSVDGSIVLGSVNGFIKFNPDSIIINRTDNTSIEISKIESGNQQKKTTSMLIITDNETPIKLGRGINFVKIHFFLNPIDVFRNTQYEYKIEGIHPEWISIGNLPELHIDNFRPGKYKLLVRAITGSGSRSIITNSYTLIVEQYFYNSTWFYVVTLSVILLLTVLYFMTIIKRNKNIMKIRQHIAQDLHDEIGGYLTGINMNLELLQKNRDRETKYFNTIHTLGKKALLAMKDSLWSLDSKSDSAQRLWDRVKGLASETFENLEIDFQFQQIEGLEKIKLTLLEKSYLIYVIKECITNSIKYGDRKLVSFIWEKSEGKHRIIISNKIGNQDPLFENGNGIYNIRNRMKTIKGNAEFKNENDYFIVILELNFVS